MKNLPNPIPRIVGAVLLIVITLIAPAVRAATNTIIFDLANFGADAVSFKQVKIAPRDSSFPRGEGNTIVGRDWSFRLTDGIGRFTNDMVTGDYDITFTNRFRATTVQITVPDTNSPAPLWAAQLTSAGTNSPSNLSAYSQSQANARFAAKWSLASNGVIVSTSPTQLNLVGFDGLLTNQSGKISIGAPSGGASSPTALAIDDEGTDLDYDQ